MDTQNHQNRGLNDESIVKFYHCSAYRRMCRHLFLAFLPDDGANQVGKKSGIGKTFAHIVPDVDAVFADGAAVVCDFLRHGGTAFGKADIDIFTFEVR